eukprot:TRINITY_DN11425_c0_g1_i1.p1 TRINITY_DN11425_c0_g1~~TRINITY_DN11425_c0_g1_i1.p1  ORF type:complete len:338 (-),score=57.52 TRINITY_DN11425_c0_g1_i1:143-1096(-)
MGRLIEEEVLYRHKKLRHQTRFDATTTVRPDEDTKDDKNGNAVVPVNASNGNEQDKNPLLQIDDSTLLDIVLKMDVSFLEELYTNEERNYISNQNTYFWTNHWRNFNLDEAHWKTYLRMQDTGKFDAEFFQTGYKQMAKRVISFTSLTLLKNASDSDVDLMLRLNINAGLFFFSMWNCMYDVVTQMYNVSGMKDRMLVGKLKCKPVSVRTMMEKHPLVSDSREIVRLMDLAKDDCGLLKDETVFLLLLGMFMCNPKNCEGIKDFDYINDVYKEYETLIRRYLLFKLGKELGNQAIQQCDKMIKHTNAVVKLLNLMPQ